MHIYEIIEKAYAEDMPEGDITTDALIDTKQISEGKLVAKASGTLAGIKVFKECFKYIDNSVSVRVKIKDGRKVKRGDVIAQIKGKTSSILKAERVALNILQRMSGIATLSSEYAKKVKPYKAEVYDTRKTTPNFRVLERQAVAIGGCMNHRKNLSDMVMIKDNHIKAVGSITDSVLMAKMASKKKIAVEVESIKQFEEAKIVKPDIIMLDNMSVKDMKECVKLNDTKIKLEATGNVTLETVKKIAATGVDRISTGQLTHSYKSLDISLKF